MSHAVQAPRMGLDMMTSGNTYDDSTNTMTVGGIDNCLTSDPGNNAQHNHTTHLIVQDVEDLVGWLARLNYDGGRMRPSTVNFSPFTDNSTGQNVSFVNLPLDAGVHRDIVTASSIPPQAAGAQTAVIGSTYNGTQASAVSPDTPPKSPPDGGSYSAPGGGVLAAVNVQVLPGQAGLPGHYIDLDDGNPHAPGSEIVVFSGTGVSTIDVAETSLGDGFHGEGVPCAQLAPAPQAPAALPPIPVPSVPTPSAPQFPSGADLAESDGDPNPPGQPLADYDGDGFSDQLEAHVGTDPNYACTNDTDMDANPADFNRDLFTDIFDIVQLAGKFGQAVPPAARYDIAPEPAGNNSIGVIDDIARLAGLFGETCGAVSSSAMMTIAESPPGSYGESVYAEYCRPAPAAQYFIRYCFKVYTETDNFAGYPRVGGPQGINWHPVSYHNICCGAQINAGPYHQDGWFHYPDRRQGRGQITYRTYFPTLSRYRYDNFLIWIMVRAAADGNGYVSVGGQHWYYERPN